MSKIIYTMASCNREDGLRKVTRSVLPQCDELWVYLNGYKTTPDFLLKNSKIKIFSSNQFGDCGDIGKFHDCEKLRDCYHFTIDDDINYPPDYSKRMISQIEKYQRKKVIGVHGAKINFPCQNYYKDRWHCHFKNKLANDTPVHIIGTGTCAYHTSTISVKKSDFKEKNMADIWFSIIGQQQKVPFIIINREQNWLSPIINREYENNSIFYKSKNKPAGQLQTKILNDFDRNFKFEIF